MGGQDGAAAGPAADRAGGRTGISFGSGDFGPAAFLGWGWRERIGRGRDLCRRPGRDLWPAGAGAAAASPGARGPLRRDGDIGRRRFWGRSLRERIAAGGTCAAGPDRDGAGKRKKAPRRAGATLLGAGKMSCTGEKLGAKRLYCCGRQELCVRPEGGSADRKAGEPAENFLLPWGSGSTVRRGRIPPAAEQM